MLVSTLVGHVQSSLVHAAPNPTHKRRLNCSNALNCRAPQSDKWAGSTDTTAHHASLNATGALLVPPAPRAVPLRRGKHPRPQLCSGSHGDGRRSRGNGSSLRRGTAPSCSSKDRPEMRAPPVCPPCTARLCTGSALNQEPADALPLLLRRNLSRRSRTVRQRRGGQRGCRQGSC